FSNTKRLPYKLTFQQMPNQKMPHRLKSILLIDDDEATNFVHTFAIKKADCTDSIITAQNGREALELLKSNKNKSTPQPNIIFLDINMPVMDGWEFLEEYEKLDKDQQGDVVLIMLTTSLNPDDVEKANTFSTVNGFRNKPLTAAILAEIVDEFFPPNKENTRVSWNELT
ncbi:MAG: response regulator, partial [Cryomorphaceae bacterium]